ncbi:MAG: aromatic ring-hydroxylating dioxygenase subunit alpha [Nitrospira sp.]|nr:aromatic ring-hydroxylating dioxygenase subunit alpha [Nitrospira sp.]
MLKGFWYIAGESTAIRAGRPFASVLCNQPLVLFRDGQGRVHALDNRCPHKGVPLSSAWQEGDSLRCPFHGWRFVASGECVEVPAIGKVAHPSPASACVKTFPAEERDGWVWVYMGNDRCPKPSVPPPSLPAPADGSPMVSVRRSAEAKVRWDFAVDSLMDPAHVPFVHHNYFRRREAARKKDKVFTRLPLGFRTISQNVLLPDTFIFRALSLRLGSATTTVDFVLPGIHSERWEIGARFASVMLVATPLTDERSRFDICVGWNFLRGVPVGGLVRRTLKTILGQDRDVLELQEQGFGRQGSMLLNLESDTLAVWYRQLKKYYSDTLAGVHDPQHPVPEKVTLSWTT